MSRSRTVRCPLPSCSPHGSFLLNHPSHSFRLSTTVLFWSLPAGRFLYALWSRFSRKFLCAFVERCKESSQDESSTRERGRRPVSFLANEIDSEICYACIHHPNTSHRSPSITPTLAPSAPNPTIPLTVLLHAPLPHKGGSSLPPASSRPSRVSQQRTMRSWPAARRARDWEW